MRVEITGRVVVFNAYYQEYKGVPSLFVDTQEKWADYSTSKGYHHLCEEGYPYHFGVDFYTEDGFESVVLIPESEDDVKIVNRLDFVLCDKDQIWFIFPEFKE